MIGGPGRRPAIIAVSSSSPLMVAAVSTGHQPVSFRGSHWRHSGFAISEYLDYDRNLNLVATVQRRYMRVSKAQMAKNRSRLLAAAGRAMRKRGIDGIGIDALASAAGMTHGAIYSQFAGKDELAAAAIAQSLAENTAAWHVAASKAGPSGARPNISTNWSATMSRAPTATIRKAVAPWRRWRLMRAVTASQVRRAFRIM